MIVIQGTSPQWPLRCAAKQLRHTKLNHIIIRDKPIREFLILFVGAEAVISDTAAPPPPAAEEVVVVDVLLFDFDATVTFEVSNVSTPRIDEAMPKYLISRPATLPQPSTIDVRRIKQAQEP